ncbi:hypothetical protein DZF91_37800 [Actinomadura logoneensis]|uniref:DUF2871 family protein n=1 Tax=Actinomadura logoneensis TaxID=2293572 RepID=A0A372J922_9ACTN|nr:hypothetical protein [Actinomadura logoneensis]RFU36490.1 hypothetical protein DZF91_37800 [Actinomadura logoneensis]
MEYAALGAWILAALAGAYLLVRWLAAGGLRGQPAKVTRFPAAVLVGHPLSALTGLAAWTLFVATGRIWCAWLAFAILLAAAFQGLLLFTRWLVGDRGGRHARGADQRFPATAVVVHGLVAVTTFVLVLFASLTAARR